MKSYAYIYEIKGEKAVCGVELIPVERRNAEEYVPYETGCMHIALKSIPISLGKVEDGDILVVEHNCRNITFIYCKDEIEKARRLELLRESQEDWL